MGKTDKPRLHDVLNILDSGACIRVVYEDDEDEDELPVMNIRKFRSMNYQDGRQYSHEVRKTKVSSEFIEDDAVLPVVVFTFICKPFK